MSEKANLDLDEDELGKKLLECCEKAYLNGIPSSEIYRALHSPEILFPDLFLQNQDILPNGLTKDKAKSKANKKLSEDSLPKSISRLIFITIFITISTLFGHILLCKFLDVNPLKFFPSLLERRCLISSHPLIMEMVRPVANCSICHSAETGSVLIELHERPTKEAFSEIAYSSRPIIIRQGAFKNDERLKTFSFERLKDIFESEEGGVDTVSDECQFLPFRSPFTSLRNAFDRISSNDGEEWKEPWYIGWSNCHPGVATKLRKIVPRPEFIPEDSGPSAIDWIFIGSPGLGAVMHIDYVRRPSWQAQLSGIKTWILRPPPECEEFCPESIKFTIYPGDLLFLETNTWIHGTNIEGDDLSISIGSEYD